MEPASAGQTWRGNELMVQIEQFEADLKNKPVETWSNIVLCPHSALARHVESLWVIVALLPTVRCPDRMKPQIITKVICHHESGIHTTVYLEFSSPSLFLPTRSHAAVTALAPERRPGADRRLPGVRHDGQTAD